MEQKANEPPAATAADVSAALADPDRRAFLPPVSDRLVARLIDGAAVAGESPASGRAARHDGWTPDAIRTFLHALAATGVVTDAARAAGMSFQSAYNLRNRAGGGPFHLAWVAAQRRARRRLADELMARAMRGSVDLVVRDGAVQRERHRFDNRLGLALLARLDRQAEAEDEDNARIRVVAADFDRFVELICAGDDEATGGFVEAGLERDRLYLAAREAEWLARLGLERRGPGGRRRVPAGPGDVESDPVGSPLS